MNACFSLRAPYFIAVAIAAISPFTWTACVVSDLPQDPNQSYDPEREPSNDLSEPATTTPSLRLAPIASSNDEIPPLDNEGCPGIFAQDHLPTFELTIDPAAWAQLYEDWIRGRELNALDLDETIYRPLREFRYGDIVIKNVHIRLRGNPTFWIDQNKMQFQVSFDEVRKDGRFLGMRKVLFDAATFNRHFLRDRLSLSIMRNAGIDAPCANSARVMINGEYYGLFTSIEKVDDVFLERVFPESPHGDLWKRAKWQLKTNTDSYDNTRLETMKDLADDNRVTELAEYLDIPQALKVWAAEAVIPNSDGAWAGGLNFYLYDHPQRGKFVLIPWDLDNTFTRLDCDDDPVTHRKTVRFHGRPLYDASLTDSAYFSMYIDAVESVMTEAYQLSDIQALIGGESELPLDNLSADQIDELGIWSHQLRDAAFEDVNKPFSDGKVEERRARLSKFIADRERYLRDWMQCWRDGGIRDNDNHCEPASALPTPPYDGDYCRF